MGGGRSKKRKHAQFALDMADQENTLGVGATLALLSGEKQLRPPKHSEDSKSETEEWTIVGKAGKKLKKTNYPSLGYSELHKLQSSVNIHQLQALVLYCLADGTSPQWVSVRHHGMIQKAVVLFVPGLEKGMFDGSIGLEDLEEDLIDLVEPGEKAIGSANEAPKNITRGIKPRDHANETTGELEEDVIDLSEPHEIANPFISDANSPQSARVVAANGLAHSNSNEVLNIKTSATSPDDYVPTLLESGQLPDLLKPLAKVFSHLWPVKAPGDERYGKVHSPLHAMLNSPITRTQEEKREDKKIKGPGPARESKNWESRRTPITEFIATKEELQDNEYVLHHACFTAADEKLAASQRRVAEKQTADKGWVDTMVEKLEDGIVAEEHIEKGSLTAGRSVLAMDCEMCLVEGGQPALTRISLVEWDGNVLMDEYVKPDKPIIDYLTRYSGITPAKLEHVRTNLEEIQSRLLKEITAKHILVGHSLNSDLQALRLTHPFVIDTSILYPHPRGPPMKSSLKWLAQKYLGREIQKGHGTMGHDSIEDARACLDLVKMKCERGPHWGTVEATNESIFKRLKRASKAGTDAGRIGAIVDHGSPERNFGSMASYCIGCKDDAEIVAGIKRAVLGDPDGSFIPAGGVDFTWARLQELAGVRGWLLDHRNPSSDTPQTPTDVSPAILAATINDTVGYITAIRDFLPPCTLLVVYSGTGDPRELGRLQEMQRTFKKEYRVKKWDELSVKWTDNEEQALKAACKKARDGLGFVAIT